MLALQLLGLGTFRFCSTCAPAVLLVPGRQLCALQQLVLAS